MKKIRIFALAIILVLITAMTSSVKAVESISFVAEPSVTSLKEGQEVIITLKLSDVNVGEDGVFTFGGNLVYDSNVFEEVTKESFTSQNNWSIAYNSENTDKKGTFLATNNTGATTDQIIGTLKLVVKSKLKSTSTNVTFTNLSSEGESTLTVAEQKLTFNVTGTVVDTDNNQNNNTGNTNQGNNNNNSGIIVNGGSNSTQQGNNNSNSGNQTTTTTQKDNTTSNGKIPQTGVENTVIIIAIVTLLAGTIVFCVRLIKNKDIK